MLVVDDDAPSRRLLEGYLLADGYEVLTAADGPQALALARERPPDVVLLDVMMPGMTGHEVCRALKTDPRTRMCQVMLVTALDATPDLVHGLDVGADDYATKPVRREELLAHVRALVRARGLLRDLERARNELAERNAELSLKKSLAQSIVHDLKSPLAGILGNLELLAGRSGHEVQPLIERCMKGAERMRKMILDLLDVERIEDGQLVPDVTCLDLADLARGAIDEHETQARSRRVELSLVADGTPCAAADPALVRRIVDNLLANALAHSPSGGRVELRVGSRPEGVELAVTDQGPGVPEELREKVFEKYARVGNPGDSSNRGLGLTFCRLAIEAHGGSIWVEAGATGGACFRALLPAAATAAERDAPPIPA
jgi:signal transduction histidine kinase